MATAPRRARAEVTVIGLGPAGPEYLSAMAQAAIAAVPLLYLRTARHPAAEPLVAEGALALDRHYEEAATFSDAYREIVEEVVAGAIAHGRVGYAVPGSPSVLETTVAMLRSDERVVVDIVEGMSFVDLAWSRLGIDPVEAGVRLVDGERFALDAARDHGPLLVGHVWNQATLAEIKLAVPDEAASCIVLSHLGLDDEAVEEIALSALDRVVPDHLTCLYLPSLAEPVGIELARLEAVVAELRRSCPWDAAQSHTSLIRHLIEECYEAVEAIEQLGEPPDPAAAAHLEEELGDVLCQVLFHSVLAAEEGLFTLSDVARTVHDKLVFRHPHVFGDADRQMSVDAVLTQWEELKRQEKGRDSVMDGIPKGLPALVLVSKLERKADGAGLGWEITAADGPWTQDAARLDAEGFGALLLSLGQLAAHHGIDAEEALRRAAARYRRRFLTAERLAADAGVSLAEATVDERRRLWDDAARF